VRLAAPLYETAVQTHPGISEGIGRGEFGALRGWLRENVHRHGSRYDPDGLVECATGRPPDAAPYLGYLKGKFGDLYGL
jgi:carboxypeptidase Taq